MGLSRFANAYPNQISGGMAQRAALARSIIMKPELLLLDEPMGALDDFTRADIQDVIYRIWNRSKMTMILVTHDISEAVDLSDRIVVMTPRPGKVSEVS
ncbi:MAG: ABC transporter ATP-binding protein [Acetilactobacillus jinshanensis]